MMKDEFMDGGRLTADHCVMVGRLWSAIWFTEVL
jgi:hypothetical protein